MYGSPPAGLGTAGRRVATVQSGTGPSAVRLVHPDYVADSGFGQPKNDIAPIRLGDIRSRSIATSRRRRCRVSGRTPRRIGNDCHQQPQQRARRLHLDLSAPQPFGRGVHLPGRLHLHLPRPSKRCALGDSGSGFVEILNGRATLVGVTSNIDGGAGDCIAVEQAGAARGRLQTTATGSTRRWA